MNIILLNIEDGHGLLPVVVEDMVAADRLQRFIREGMAALIEKQEAKMEVQL